MKKVLFLLVTLSFSSCCSDSFYIAPFSVTILKDNQPLIKEHITPVFYYTDKDGKENVLHITGSGTSTYAINQSSELKKLSFRPVDIFIRYYGLPETDTLQILLDYACDKKGSCGCKAVVLKYMKFNSVLLSNDTIRK